MLKGLLGTTALVGMLAVSTIASATIVTNGSFDNGLTGWTVNASGTTPGIGVTVVTLGGIDTTGYGDAVPLYNSNTHAAFFVDDNAAQSISQWLTLSPNTQYNLSYGLYATVTGAANPNFFILTSDVNGSSGHLSLRNSNVTTGVPVGVWTTEIFSFVTDGNTQYKLVFDFDSGATPAKDVLLTGIAVPEPASIALLGLGMIGIGAVSKRRRSVAAY
jgi:hypothetical protein